jgi:anti-anti-sigma regulatory factor
MLRITENLKNDKAVSLRLDGTISDDAFAELAELCARHRLDPGQILIIDMAGVNFMTHDAARKLAQLRAESLQIVNCSPFIAALLDSAKTLE